MNKNVLRKAFFATKIEIETKLINNLKITKMNVVDISGGCGSSFLIQLKSPDFNGMNIISQHRKINEILKDELKEIHALQLKTEADNNV